MKNQIKKLSPQLARSVEKEGFTVVEVIVAGSIMIILCVGLLSVFSYVVKINRGEYLRAQALSVLQKEAEFYRSLKFVPGAETSADLNNHRSTWLRAAPANNPHIRPQITTPDNRVFNITVTVTNISPSATEELCRFKEITITATPATTETGWLANLQTTLTIQRVRAN